MDRESLINFKWCIENDFQVYVKPINYSKNFKIAVRKGGISTKGKDTIYCKVKGMNIYSKETLGNVIYRNQSLAIDMLPSVYKYLKETYG